MKAFYFGKYDGDCYYFENCDPSQFCPNCDTYIGHEFYYPQSIKVKRHMLNFFSSYDGVSLMSEKAKVFLNHLNIKGLSFKKVNKNPPFYVPVTQNIVQFDKEKRRTRFEKYCDLCGNYEYVVGATPVFLKNMDIVENMGWYNTDINFGSNRSKHPLIIVGEGLKLALENEFNQQIYFQAVQE